MSVSQGYIRTLADHRIETQCRTGSTQIRRKSIMKHHLVEVVISEHNLIVLKLIKDPTRDLSTCVHYIRNDVFMHSFNGLG